ncbi:MAG: hypothetical protein M1818_006045 [Claussenomyces sp. TS43310]|nr:MAG: hypothetical protein M1818_006045 [Claussenomyces sp. TS43310]
MATFNEKPGAPGTQMNMPMRQTSASSALSAEAVPMGDPKDTSELLDERLRAWKHAVGYLEDYVTATEKVERAHAKEYEKVLKASYQKKRKKGSHADLVIEHFRPAEGRASIRSEPGWDCGIVRKHEIKHIGQSDLTEHLGLANSHAETEKNLKGSVLPILERLHKEIKNKSKELASGAVKSAKEVEKSRTATQKHIELLGQHSVSFESTGGKLSPSDDPYVLQRGVYHRLHKQVLEENSHQQDLISVQNNFATFEQHIVGIIQQAMASFNQFVGGQAQRDQSMYADMLATAQRIPPDFEWKAFVGRSGDMLVDPHRTARSVDNITFANQNHKATQPLIEGTLERKSRNMLSTGYSTGYYVVTPSLYLHEYKDSDNLRKDPTPELSIYLPDAVIGSPSGQKFNVKGKDVSKGLGSKLSGTSELAFKAHTSADAEKWFEIIRMAAGSSPVAYTSAPTSPVERRQMSGNSTVSHKAAAAAPGPAAPGTIQTQGITGGQTMASPSTATPTATSAIDHAAAR